MILEEVFELLADKNKCSYFAVSITQTVLEDLFIPTVLTAPWWHTDGGWEGREGHRVASQTCACFNHVSRYVDFKCCGKTLIYIPRRSPRLKSCEWLQGGMRHGGPSPVSVTHALQKTSIKCQHTNTHKHTRWCRAEKKVQRDCGKVCTVAVHGGIRRGNHKEPVRRFYWPQSFPRVSTSRQYRNGDRVSCWHTQALRVNLGRQ